MDTATLHAVKYTPEGKIRGVQVFVPGLAYDHDYFDLDTGKSVVSQARDAAKDGWVAIAVDRIGTGELSKPKADVVTTAAHIASIDSFVGIVDDEYDSIPVVLVGHSYGSVVSAGVAANSDEIDALVITGFMYRSTAPSLEGFPQLQAASGDPVFAGEHIPEGYVTTAPDSRSFFYDTVNADPATIAADEKTKATATATETPGFTEELTTRAFAAQVKVPVLVAVGAKDYLYLGSDPSAFTSEQKKSFSAAVSVDAKVFDGAAHDLALHKNSAKTNNFINGWALKHTAS